MIYTAYSEQQYKGLPEKYRNKVLGISYKGNILQPPICPDCGEEMMESEGYLLCILCGQISRKRVLRDEGISDGDKSNSL